LTKPLTPLAVLDSFARHEDTLDGLLHSRRSGRDGVELLAGEFRTWRYGDAETASELVASLLRSHGVVKGDRVVMLSRNSDLTLLVFLALGRVGAIFVPVNPALNAGEIVYLLNHCTPRLTIVQEALLERVAAIVAAEKPSLRVIGTAALGDRAVDAAGVLAALKDVAGSSAADTRPDAQAGPSGDPQVGPEDPLVMIYTSGTTGYPKGVVHSHRNYVRAAEAFVERLHLQPGERLFAILPFYHVNALFYSFGGALACGGTLLTVAKFSASQFWQLAARYGATQLNILAAVGNILAKRPRSEYVPGHRIRKIYGGPISAEMLRAFQDEFDVPDLIEGYGMTEIPGAFNNPFEGPRKPGSIGKPARHPRHPHFVEAKIVDDAGMEVPHGEAGELLVRTPIAMLYYFDDPVQTKEAMGDGWLRTGDIARRDDEGYYYFIARKKDIIRRRGENISGAELDRVLGSHPDVLEAAAIGVPASLGDEEILAVLVARTDPPPPPEAIVEWCAAHLAAMKVPRYVVFVESLPHTASERIIKYRLKEDPALLERAFDREPPP
jgi:crotonobetaine/carnitine-CoA ligase